jgi:beta-glucosidase
MPWLAKTRAVLQAWYPGQAGARAIAEVLTGATNPSGRLPITFPHSLDQTPRPQLEGLGTPWGTPTQIAYDEGAEVGYRWFHQTGTQPLFAFGHGLTYTQYAYADLHLDGGETVTATFTVTNTGERAGADVPQLYLVDAAGDARARLLGFERVELDPGAMTAVTITADPRLLGRYDTEERGWQIIGGTYRVAVARAADDLVLTGEVGLPARRFAG